MQVFVKQHVQTITLFDVDDSHTIADLKQKIMLTTGIPTQEQILTVEESVHTIAECMANVKKTLQDKGSRLRPRSRSRSADATPGGTQPETAEPEATQAPDESTQPKPEDPLQMSIDESTQREPEEPQEPEDSQLPDDI